MKRLGSDSKAVITRFVYNMWNGLLAHPVLKDIDYEAALTEEPNAAEQAIAVFLNVLELDASGACRNAPYAELRAGQYLRQYCDPSYRADPPFEDWEYEISPYHHMSSGPMP